MGLKPGGVRGSLRNVSVGTLAIPDSEGTHQYNATAGSGSTLEDVIGSLDGAITGATWQTGAGAEDSYLLYDGSTDVTDLGSASQSELSHLGVGQGTIFAWIRPDSTNRGQILGTSTSNTNDPFGGYIDYQGPNGDFDFAFLIDGTRNNVAANPNPPTGTWFPVAMTGDGSTLEAYWADPSNSYSVSSLGTTSLNSATETDLSQNMALGKTFGGGEDTFDGAQDIVWFDDVQRSQSDIQTFVDDSKGLYA